MPRCAQIPLAKPWRLARCRLLPGATTGQLVKVDPGKTMFMEPLVLKEEPALTESDVSNTEDLAIDFDVHLHARYRTPVHGFVKIDSANFVSSRQHTPTSDGAALPLSTSDIGKDFGHVFRRRRRRSYLRRCWTRSRMENGISSDARKQWCNVPRSATRRTGNLAHRANMPAWVRPSTGGYHNRAGNIGKPSINESRCRIPQDVTVSIHLQV